MGLDSIWIHVTGYIVLYVSPSVCMTVLPVSAPTCQIWGIVYGGAFSRQDFSRSGSVLSGVVDFVI